MEILGTSTVERAGERGYAYYRIPGIVAMDSGSIIVYYEARQGGDWSLIDLCLRRSLDGGKKWMRRKTVMTHGGKNTMNNPVMIADGKRLHLLCFENYKRFIYRYSDDEGETWSDIKDISAVLERGRFDYSWTCAAAGPGHGIKLKNGRLLATMWLSSDPKNIFAHHPSKIATVYSDDGGENWKLGEIFAPEGTVDPNEACVVETNDGKVLMNIRTCRPAGEDKIVPHYRTLALSDTGIDGWKTWTDTSLPDPVCAGGMCDCPEGILFTNCESWVSRSNHTLKLSRDGGKTWSDKIMYEPLAGYSDCCYNKVTGTVFTAYEKDAETEIAVAEIKL